jgi:hypothetical protein
MDIEQRKRMAAESLLENESLREGLDDESASALLDWGTALAQRIAESTAGVEDDEEAEEMTCAPCVTCCARCKSYTRTT